MQGITSLEYDFYDPLGGKQHFLKFYFGQNLSLHQLDLFTYFSLH